MALLVLALAFLNFGHASISLGGELKLTPDVWCGDPLLPDSPDHSPCHACRIGGGADLPPLPSLVAAVEFTAQPILYASRSAPALRPALLRPVFARGPPSLA